MLENIKKASELNGLFIQKNRPHEIKSVHKKLVEDYLIKKWENERENKNTTRIRESKPHNILFEDRVWCLLYRMGFEYLNDQGGAIIALSDDTNKTIKNQIDIVGIDREVAIAIEC